MFASLPFVLALVVAASPAPAGPLSPLALTPARATRLDTDVAKLAGRQSGQSPALAIAIVEDGKLVYNRAFGNATPDTRFWIGSVTKMMTAVAVMQLVEEHRIDLEARVATYLPDAPHAAEMTVRQLLQHTSGLWNYGDFAFNSGAVVTPTTPRHILALAATHPLTSPPGTKWAYSNTGYVELGLIVEHVSGESLATYEQRHIFGPAGMRDTTLGAPAASTPVASGYLSGPGPAGPPFDSSWLFADGDIVSTAADLARFDIALLNGSLLTPQAFARMQSDTVATGDGGTLQGLGVVLVPGALHFVGHHGGFPGFEAENETVPAAGYAMVVLSDAFDFSTRRANNAILATLFADAVAAQAPAPVPTGDPAVTAKFRSTLSGLLRGLVDRSQLSAAANAALTPELLAQTSAQLGPLGTIERASCFGSVAAPLGTAHTCDAVFSSGHTVRWRFVIGSDGKIAAIFSTAADSR